MPLNGQAAGQAARQQPLPAIPLFRPFVGYRPEPARADEVVAPPYDVVNTEEARTLAAERPWSFLHISKPEIDLPAGTDPHSDAAYAKAAENFRRMAEAGVLRRDREPHYYVYRLTMGDHVQTGIVAAASVCAYEEGRIRRHEFTRPDKEDDRVRQIDAVNAQTGPVLLAHRPHEEARALLAAITRAPAEVDVLAGDGIRHELWVVRERDLIGRLTRAYEALDAAYIADGHHRSAAAARVARQRRPDPDVCRGEEPYDSFLVVAFPADEMLVLDYNRVVRDLNGLETAAFLDAVGERFTVRAVGGKARPTEPHQFGMYLAGQWYCLAPREPVPPPSEPVRRLDVSLLSDRLLEPVLGITDLRRDPRIDFVGGMRGLGELERRVDSGEMAVAFALYPTRMADLLAVADAGDVMPPKSTWFEPKLADGLVSYPLD